jgi:enoyl-CoA hydratase
MSAYQFIKIEEEGYMGLLTIDRQEALNALNSDVVEELNRALDDIAKRFFRVLVIRGAGDKAFVAGADIRAMSQMDAEEAASFSLLGHQMLRKIERLPFPVIAAVNGFALGGGCELALACDLIVATESALFGQPEVGLGVIPGMGGTLRLTRLIGLQRARELIYTGRRIKAREALELGLVLAVVENEAALMERCRKIARQVASKGPQAVAASKRALQQALHLSIDEGVQMEAEAFSALFDGDEQKEGMSAFIERRKPGFDSTLDPGEGGA